MKINSDGWNNILSNCYNENWYIKLCNFIEDEYKNKIIYPKYNDIFKAFELCSFEDCKVVIIGQDPYFNHNQANGLAFSVNKGVVLPPSLKNIYKEIEDDLNVQMVSNGDLSYLANQGVLLLNTILTVEDGKPKSHQNVGWEKLTDLVITKISELKTNVVFILWGIDAINKVNIIKNKDKHLILTSSHPSPLSSYRGFFKSKPFSKTNEYLRKTNQKEIKWTNN